MASYRKKPVVIQAVVWDGTSTAYALVDSLNTLERVVLWRADNTLSIQTLEGEQSASLGDYIIQGVKGELYPCKPDIFALTYDMVEGV